MTYLATEREGWKRRSSQIVDTLDGLTNVVRLDQL